MKKLHRNHILICLIFLFVFLPIINCFPCPPECICVPTGLNEDGFTRMNYIIDCTNVTLNNNKLIYQAPSWSILEDKNIDDNDDDINTEYMISIDLSNSSSLKQFNNQAIQLTGFSFSIQSLSLTSQSKTFALQPNAFSSSLYQDLKILNLSSCCQQIPTECPQLFRPLKKLQVLDLSGSNMYKTCLDTPDTISRDLSDLILRNNDYDMNTFSHSSRFFDGVRKMRGKLDLQYSRFNMSTQLEGNCLFDIFNQISMLDLSSVKFYSTSNDIEKHIKHLLQCKTQPDQTRNGELLLHLNLRYLNLQRLPDCITNDRFPGLKQLDLSNNNIRSIDFSTFLKLSFIALAYNPIELRNISWNGNDRKYESVNLRSTLQIQTPNLMPHIKELFKITTNFDYSENCRNTSNNLTNFSMENDFSSVSLNLSQTNLYSFDIKDISRFDDLQRLDISSNYLTELNLEKQSKLTYLDCSNQKLKTLIINRDFLKLIQLKCSNNSLKTIENFSLSSHKNLQFIDLSFNQIESIENLFSNLNSRYLHTINLQSNSITQLSSKVFHSKLISLYSINLSWNKINLIKTNTFQSPNLQLLDLTGNPLKTIEAKFLFAPSLRLFYIVDNTRQLIDRCAQSTIKDNLLLTYISWFEQNGTYMKNTQKEKSEQIQMDKCLSRYTSRSKVKWMKINDQHHLKHLSLYITMAAVIVGIILGMIYLYKKKKFNFLTSLQRYRPLDRNSLMGNTDDVNHHQREDDEIVMNLDEPPFNTIHRS